MGEVMSSGTDANGPKIVFADQWALAKGDRIDLSAADDTRIKELAGRVRDQADAIREGVAKLTTALASGFQETADTVKSKLSVVETEVSFELKGEGNVLLLKASGGAAIKVKLTWNLK